MKKIAPIFLLLLCCGILASAQTTTAFEVDGIKVIYRPTKKQLINVRLYFKGGVTNYDSSNAGIERLAITGAVRCGTKKYSHNAFKDSIDSYGLGIAGDAEKDDAFINLYCTAKYFNTGWNLLSDAVVNPAYDETEFKNIQRLAVASLKRSLSNPDDALRLMAVEDAFAGTPYAISAAGTEASLTGLTVTDVKDYYYKTLLNKSRIFIVVVGNISQQDITAKIHEAFGALPSSAYKNTMPPAPEIAGNTILTQPRQLSTNYILGVMNAPSLSAPDYIPFRMAMSFLKGRLFSEIRNKRNLSYAPSAGVTPGLMPYSTVYVSTTNPKACVEIMAEEIMHARKDFFTPESLDQVKGLYITNTYINAESTTSIATMLGDAEIAGSWQIAEGLPDVIYKTRGREMIRAFKKYVKGIKWYYIGDANLASQASEAFTENVK